MDVVGKVSSFITQGMYSVATPFHPFGGAVDIIVVKQQDGTFRSTPWYVRFGKFQGVLKGAEKVVRIEVNGVEANFNMYLDNSGEAYFVREVHPGKDDDECLTNSENIDVNSTDEPSSLEGSVELPEYGSNTCDTLETVEDALESENSNSEVVLVSVDGHILTAPISSSETDAEEVELDTPQFHLGPGAGTEEYDTGEATWTSDYLSDLHSSAHNASTINGKDVCINSSSGSTSSALKKDDIFKSCLELSELALQSANSNKNDVGSSDEIHEATKDPHKKSPGSPLGNPETEKRNHEILTKDGLSLTDSGYPISASLPEVQVEAATHERNTLDMDDDGSDSKHLQFVSSNQEPQDQMDVDLAVKAGQVVKKFMLLRMDTTKVNSLNLMRQLQLQMKIRNQIHLQVRHPFGWPEISHSENVLHAGMESRTAEDAFDPNHTSIKPHDVILGNVETAERKQDDSSMTSARWRLWPIPFRRIKTLEHSDTNSSIEDVFVDSECVSPRQPPATPIARVATDSPRKQIIRTNVPTTDLIASLNLKEGQNMVNFVFSTRVLGSQKVEAHIYLWKWNARIVISDVDGTITKSDVLGQFMPLVGKDWTHSGIARFFSAIKENGYQLLFLSARAIVQAYLTKNFLFNLKQDGKSLPDGPVVISPDGLFPSLYREVIRRAPHEFKIACLEDIKALFPPDYNPFYAGFGKETDELSYRKIGIPKGKIFIINPKGEVAINHRVEVKAYTSFHTLVNDMFPPTSLVEQEDYNSWNYWKMPLPDVE
ncbi:UNVERIFIED_CONTAM: Phosphatidate phosphatase PAH1 [Sesamum radiatum]|uniref:Phosphatidate phosphatase PAH1 n=1 Tax=Sesamum radiatum TaxID=300843 RepID=A0AAW2R5Q2_SESRA